MFQLRLHPPCSPGSCGGLVHSRTAEQQRGAGGQEEQEAPVASGLAVCGPAVPLLILPGPERSRVWGSR